MRVLVAPDKFRGTLTAEQAGGAISAGWRRSRPADEIEIVPMADGGEGTLDVLLASQDGERRSVRVSGPLGDPVVAEYALVASPRGWIAVIEMARASGLALVSEERRDVRRATTRGVGELIRDALGHHPAEVIVCLGGSATNDGGAGMAQALGARLLDAEGRQLGPGGASLVRLARVDATSPSRLVRGVRFFAATDVDNPLVGPSGASAVYGPQKGASPEDVVLLDRALAHYAAVLHRDLGIDVRDLPGGGAAGGLGAGLVAFLGAHVRPGVEVVMEAVDLPGRIAAADVVVTGEGSLDEQSLRGKVVAGVLGTALDAARKVIALCGRAHVRPEGAEVHALVERFGEERAVHDARRALEDLAAEVAAGIEPVGSGS